MTECKLEERTRDVEYTQCVPQTRTYTEQVVSYRNVPEEVTENYTVMVPHEVEQTAQVQVCHMVPQQISTQSCCGNECGFNSCNSCACCGWMGRWRR